MDADKKRKEKEHLLNQLYALHKDFKNSPLFIPGECTSIVFGEGNPDATILFIGEAPGRQEDLEGRPFVGQSGRLLNRAFELAEINRNEVYITNIVKCRPPQNRTPSLEELATGRDVMLLEQIRIINPQIICTLGSAALSGLTQDNSCRITKIHGKPLQFQNQIILPLYHPAYILRNRQEAQAFLADIKKIKTLIN